ncbi:MAG: aldo/keto reductase [Bacteroidetes bacterium]|nr:MAG: aldo/keto reductase [Bacteroidota bacterium]
METRPFGRTGLTVTRMGLGLAALGRPGYINLGHAEDLDHSYELGRMEERAHTVLDAAWAAGVRAFDTARSYGRGEDFLGSWLRRRQIPAEAVQISSKWGYTYTAGWRVQAEAHEVKDHSLPVLQRQWGESQQHLGPWLDLYQIHSATLDSGVLSRTEVLGELARLKATHGLRIGLSLSGPTQGQTLDQALRVQVDGVPLFDAVQATWNVLEPSAGVALAAAHAAGLGVIIKEGLANGRLTTRNTHPSFAGARHKLEAEARRLNTTLDALALAAVLAQPWADVVLSGAATEAHLHDNLQALQVAWDEEAATRLATLAETPEAYWRFRKGLAWN